jgi:PhnB protein
MPANPPEGTPRITPYLLYEDADAAIAFLSGAFGFNERMRIPGPDGKVAHAELELGDGLIMLGHPGPEYQSPKHVGHVTQQLYVYVDDIEKHFLNAKEHGATIQEEPADQFYGDRRYGCLDPEGHHWYFAQHVRDVPPEEMQIPST